LEKKDHLIRALCNHESETIKAIHHILADRPSIEVQNALFQIPTLQGTRQRMWAEKIGNLPFDKNEAGEALKEIAEEI